MFEGVSAVIQYAFDELMIHRIMANFVPSNDRSARLLERLGFEREGYAREYLFIRDRWDDHVLDGIDQSRSQNLARCKAGLVESATDGVFRTDRSNKSIEFKATNVPQVPREVCKCGAGM